MARSASGNWIMGGKLILLALSTGSLLTTQVSAQQPSKKVPVVGGVPRIDVPADAKPNPGVVPDTSKAPPTLAPGEPPEEDPGQAPRVYTFNPLQAKKEISAGDFYRKKGNYRAAVNRYYEATQWDDGSAEAFLKLGEAREKLKEYPEAREAFAKYVTLNTDPKEAAAIQKRMAKYPATTTTKPGAK
ncbi:MAG: tetratricopeptide repeat protein [Acidobacteriota bacterium]